LSFRQGQVFLPAARERFERADGASGSGGKMSEREEYLGDGLYASFDGYQIWLRAPREGGDYEVFLDASTLAAFREFLDTLKSER
jgi:hypothetical protein